MSFKALINKAIVKLLVFVTLVVELLFNTAPFLYTVCAVEDVLAFM